MGLPHEDQYDIQQTIDLIKTLKPYQSIIVPILFTSMETTRLEYAKPLLKKNLSPKHHELISVCWDHNLDWFPHCGPIMVVTIHFSSKWLSDPF